MDFGEIQRIISIFFSTIPESLPAGILFLGILMADYAFLVFGIGLILIYAIGGILRTYSAPPDTYTLQCSPWKLSATFGALATDKKTLFETVGASWPLWISPQLSIITFATVYIITAVLLLRSSFDNRVASYASTTTGFSIAACLAVFFGYSILRFVSGCENAKSLIISIVFGALFAAVWAVAMGAWSMDNLNIVHIPRAESNQPDAKVILCDTH